MNAESIAVVGVVLLALVAGCGGTPGAPPTPSAETAEPAPTTTATPEPAGFVSVKRIETAPENATVLSVNDSRLAGVEPVQTLIRRNRTNIAHHLPKSELERVRREMPDEYRYGGGRFGWYITHRGELHRVRIVRYV